MSIGLSAAPGLKVGGERAELPGLSDRELEVLGLVAAGLNDAGDRRTADSLLAHGSPTRGQRPHQNYASLRRAAAVAQAGRLGPI